MSTAYPLDKYGTLESNRIKDEVHTLHPVTAGQYNFIVPHLAPFFYSGVTVDYFTGDIPATQEELDDIPKTRLQLGVDYTLTHRADVPKELTENALYASISFIDIELEGNVVINYRTIGSSLVMNQQQITALLAQKTTDPRSVYWNDIIIDIDFPVSDHLDDAEELYGMQALIDQMRAIEIAILGGTNNEHFHEITQINGLVQKLKEFVPNHRARKLSVSPDMFIVRQEAPVEIVLPDFDSDVHAHVKLGVVGAGGYSTISFHATIPKDTPLNSVVPGSVAYFEDAFLADQAKGHLVYRHRDGRLRMALDLGTFENVVMFVSEVAINTPNARVYTDGWGINTEVTDLPRAIDGALDVLTGGGLTLDFAKTGTIKPNTCWMIMSADGKFTRQLPANAPNNSVIVVRDHGDNATTNRGTIMGAIRYAQDKDVDGLYLDNSRGWIKFQFNKDSGKWHVISGT